MHEMTDYASEMGNTALQKTILLVDDDDDEHEIFSSALKTIGKAFNFISAKSCEGALHILKTLDPDYIFIDVNMPRINGMTCLQEIKKISRIEKIPVYMYSTQANARMVKKLCIWVHWIILLLPYFRFKSITEENCRLITILTTCLPT